MILIGIDPGLSGACAFIGPNSAAVCDMPTIAIEGGGSVTRRVHGPSLADMIRKHCPADETALVVVEDLSAGGFRARPGEQKGSSAQTVGSQYRTRGTIECVLEMLRLQVHIVHALRWKRFYKLGTDKDHSLQVARVLYPELAEELRRKADHNRAEAVLIAHYGKRVLA